MLFECLIITFLIQSNTYWMQKGDLQAKQTYLRQQILEMQYDPQEFIQFLDNKLQIGDNLDMCTFYQLKTVVQQFIKMKNPKEQSETIKQDLTANNIQHSDIEIKQSVLQQKPKQILFTKYNPNVLEYQFSKTYQCKKIQPKLKNSEDIRCYVSDPQRKTTGGFFGIGQTSFLQFKVRTPQLKWQVGRRYSDFIWLRCYLLKVYPTQIIPPIPEKKAAKRTHKHVQKRMRILQYFLNDIVNIPEFLNNKYVQGFLSISDGPKFQNLKQEADKIKASTHFTQIQNLEGQINVKLSEENFAYYTQMQKFAPNTQKIYKQITRLGKNLQTLYTNQVNTLYEMGNSFAQLHENSRQILNKLPKSSGLKKLNEIYIILNNMMIQWGNVVRNQNTFLQKNFNTFFKYVRNQMHGYTEVFQKENGWEAQFAKTKQNLEKKKEKIYNLHDVNKWQLGKDASTIRKEVIHDKVQAFKVMLPKQSQQVQKHKNQVALYVTQLHINSNQNFQRSFEKFSENFKQFTIKIKVNTQQLQQLWTQMSANFAGQCKKVQMLKQVPVIKNNDDEIMDD